MAINTNPLASLTPRQVSILHWLMHSVASRDLEDEFEVMWGDDRGEVITYSGEIAHPEISGSTLDALESAGFMKCKRQFSSGGVEVARHCAMTGLAFSIHGALVSAQSEPQNTESMPTGNSTESPAPSVFISYSWDDESHRQWVRTLAARLRSDGVDVKLDCWEAVPGDQLPAFMERMIRENQFVIIICTPRYKARSDARVGGVGYEGDIMTAEVMTTVNHRKFIPVWRSGSWTEAAPGWLAAKYHINLSNDPYLERDYEDLVRTLLGVKETPPPLGKPMATIQTNTSSPPHTKTSSGEFEDIGITRVIVEEVTQPRNDGTRGSALYAIPFALSRRPPQEWAQLFAANWDRPPSFTNMHRPGIGRVRGASIVLNGTSIEEVERYHRDTLQLVVSITNTQYRDWKRREDEQRARERARREEHRKHIDEAAGRIHFD